MYDKLPWYTLTIRCAIYPQLPSPHVNFFSFPFCPFLSNQGVTHEHISQSQSQLTFPTFLLPNKLPSYPLSLPLWPLPTLSLLHIIVSHFSHLTVHLFALFLSSEFTTQSPILVQTFSSYHSSQYSLFPIPQHLTFQFSFAF